MRPVPIWLLDVDGVLNANRPGWSERPRQAIAYAAGEPFKMRWSATLLNKISDLHTTGRVELRWCTTWCPWADQLEQIFGLPPLARSIPEPMPSSGAWPDAKVGAARNVLREGRPLIWTDDEAIPPEGPPRDALTNADVPTLLIEPLPNRGLQPAHLARIEQFLDENAR
ncbi:hypothetical protein [Marmoricola sp. RAF53]|uniref:hypothetical protein n=1 Tax=Marmoricola sp. RAF53 TaxID=3233059 RepID=UPI003F954FBF